MISFITTGRDDDFGIGFLDRLHTSISKNIEVIEKCSIPYEYLLVEWSPTKNYIANNDKFKDLFKNKNLIDIIVKSDVAIKENLDPKIFLEYFAKNVGIRMSKFDILVIVNADIVLPEKSMKMICDLIQNNFDKNHFYKLVNRVIVDNNLQIIKKQSVYKPKSADGAIAGYFAGDFLLIDKSTAVKYGQGYDETNPAHRTISQISMDGEMLWNLHRNGITLKFLDAEYWHIEHNRSNPHDNVYNTKGYLNKKDWGFTKYTKKVISGNLIEIGDIL